MHSSSSHILFIKDPPNDNFRAGFSNKNRTYHFKPKMGIALEYQRLMRNWSNLLIGIGTRYTQKGQNISYVDSLFYESNGKITAIELGGHHKSSIHYLQLPLSVGKRYFIKGAEFELQAALTPEIKIYGYDNYGELNIFNEILIKAEKYQKDFGISTFLKGNFLFKLNHANLLRIGLYTEYQLSRYWEDNGNYRNGGRFALKDPNSSWGFFTHLSRTHLFNVGIEVGYSFGWGKD